MENEQNTSLRFLIGYYGLLQSLHLLTLARAGVRILQGDPAPFPILPPPGGWTEQSMAFLYGLAGTDVVGILLGIFFAYRAILKNDFNPRLGTLSLTIFITGAIVFGAGTYPSGAWAAHPTAYWVMVGLFLPSVLLFILLLKNEPKP
jgi:CDP-diglyceride synthetase